MHRVWRIFAGLLFRQKKIGNAEIALLTVFLALFFRLVAQAHGPQSRYMPWIHRQPMETV